MPNLFKSKFGENIGQLNKARRAHSIAVHLAFIWCLLEQWEEVSSLRHPRWRLYHLECGLPLNHHFYWSLLSCVHSHEAGCDLGYDQSYDIAGSNFIISTICHQRENGANWDVSRKEFEKLRCGQHLFLCETFDQEGETWVGMMAFRLVFSTSSSWISGVLVSMIRIANRSKKCFNNIWTRFLIM